MKAIVYHRYGSPGDVLRYEEIEKPLPGDDEVLIKVRAASVNPLDCGELNGVPYFFRLVFGMREPSEEQPGRPGVDLAGEVEAVGRNVAQFKAGDEVFGVCVSDPKAPGTKVWMHRQGSFAEYVCASDAALAAKPENVTFEEAASAPVAALTALQGLRDKGKIQPGQRVVINGASGGVGTFAVQIAKSFGAEVTGVCSRRNVEMVRGIGADHVIDYTQQNFTTNGQHYDIIFDCAGGHSLSEYKRALVPGGICVLAGDLTAHGIGDVMSRLIGSLLMSKFGDQKFLVFLARPSKDHLAILHDLMQAGKVQPMIDRRYRLSEVAEAIRYVAEKHARGKVVVTMDRG